MLTAGGEGGEIGVGDEEFLRLRVRAGLLDDGDGGGGGHGAGADMLQEGGAGVVHEAQGITDGLLGLAGAAGDVGSFQAGIFGEDALVEAGFFQESEGLAGIHGELHEEAVDGLGAAFLAGAFHRGRERGIVLIEGPTALGDEDAGDGGVAAVAIDEEDVLGAGGLADFEWLLEAVGFDVGSEGLEITEVLAGVETLFRLDEGGSDGETSGATTGDFFKAAGGGWFGWGGFHGEAGWRILNVEF